MVQGPFSMLTTCTVNYSGSTHWSRELGAYRSVYRCRPDLKVYKGNDNTLRPRQDGRHFTDDTFKCIFLNENVWIPITISLKFVPKGPINNIPAMVQIMAWRRPGEKPLSQPMVVSLPTHICVTRPQWVNIQMASKRTHDEMISSL